MAGWVAFGGYLGQSEFSSGIKRLDFRDNLNLVEELTLVFVGKINRSLSSV